jgi:endonuclease YncB( thermonuclease family)
MTATQWLLNRRRVCFLCFLIFWAGVCPAFAGDSIYGTITEVRSAETVTFDYGDGKYQVRIIGVDAPRNATLAKRARDFVSSLVLGKKVRIRFDHRAPNGVMVSRVFTDDPVLGIREVGVELVRAGLAQRQRNYDYKYGELSAAENEARSSRRGLWAIAIKTPATRRPATRRQSPKRPAAKSQPQKSQPQKGQPQKAS